MSRSVNRSVVAEIAGCSPITVSRVFGRKSSVVTEETRQRVLAASKACGYIPNAAARAIRTKRFHRVAFVVTTFDAPGHGSMPNVLGYLTAVADTLAEQGYSVIYEHFHLEEGTRRLIEPPRLFMELAADGIIGMSGGFVPPEVDAAMTRLGAPVVWVNRNADEGVPAVVADEFGAARQLTRHLIDLGHRRIGYVSFSQLVHYSAVQRLAGVRAELQAAGLSTKWLVRAKDRFSRLQTIEQLLAAAPPITALICYNSLIYRSALQVAAEKGIRIPADLSMGFFASEWELDANMFPVTAVLVPEGKMAVVAVQTLLPMIEQRRSADEPETAMPIHTDYPAGAYVPPAGSTPRLTMTIPPVAAELRLGRTTAPPSDSAD